MANKSRCWCFTLNNPQKLSAEDQNGIKASLSKARYWVIGTEKGENGTPHWQGFVYTHNQVRITRIKELLCWDKHKCHVQMCNGTAEQNMRYCKKGEQPKAEWEEMKHLGPNYGKNAVVEEHGDAPASQKRKGEDGKAASEAKWRRLHDLAKSGKMVELGEEFPREAIVCVGHIQK